MTIGPSEAEEIARLRQSEWLYREMVENVNSVVLLWGTDLRIQYINSYGARLFGFRVSELIGQSVLGTIVPDDESTGRDLRELMWEIVSHPERFRQNDNENLTKSGERIWLSWSNQGIHNSDGTVRMVISVANDITALKQAQEQALEQAQQKAMLEERQRLARELHDSVSQALYGIVMGARTARRRSETDPSHLAEPLDYVLSLAEAALAEMRALIFELRPESLEREGLIAALRRHATATEARFGVAVQAQLGEEPDVPFEVKEALYRISQEALNNVVKHARASTARLRVEVCTSSLDYSLTDDGCGFDVDGEFPGHLGIRSMRERAVALGGSLDVRSSLGTGTTISVSIPITQHPRVSSAD